MANIINKYSDAIGDLEYYMKDITNSMFGNTSELEYVAIERPKTNSKTGNKSVSFYVVSKDGSVKLLVFTSGQTLGIKRLNDDWKTSQYNFSISQKDNTQITLLQFDDGTTVKKTAIYNTETKSYEIQSIMESIPVEQLDNSEILSDDSSLSGMNIRVVQSNTYRGKIGGYPAYLFSRIFEEVDENGKKIQELNPVVHPLLDKLHSLPGTDIPSSGKQVFFDINELFTDNTVFSQSFDFVKKMFNLQISENNSPENKNLNNQDPNNQKDENSPEK